MSWPSLFHSFCNVYAWLHCLVHLLRGLSSHMTRCSKNVSRRCWAAYLPHYARGPHFSGVDRPVDPTALGFLSTKSIIKSFSNLASPRNIWLSHLQCEAPFITKTGFCALFFCFGWKKMEDGKRCSILGINMSIHFMKWMILSFLNLHTVSVACLICRYLQGM